MASVFKEKNIYIWKVVNNTAHNEGNITERRGLIECLQDIRVF